MYVPLPGLIFFGLLAVLGIGDCIAALVVAAGALSNRRAVARYRRKVQSIDSQRRHPSTAPAPAVGSVPF